MRRPRPQLKRAPLPNVDPTSPGPREQTPYRVGAGGATRPGLQRASRAPDSLTYGPVRLAIAALLVVLAGALLSRAAAHGAAGRRLIIPAVWVDPTAPPATAALYVVYGQSNAVGHGRRLQPYYGPPDQALLLRDPDAAAPRGYWTPLADPFEAGAGGSWIPRLASRLSRSGPVAFVPAGRDGFAIADLAPGSDWYRSRLLPQARSTALPVRAVLYWQGEADAIWGLDAAAYRDQLARLAAAVKRDLGAPLVVAELGPPPPTVDILRVEAIRSAQRACWATCENVVRGPTFADIVQVSTVDWHFSSDDELSLAADRWYDALVAAHLAN
jgi:Carbohydrate esterase, sialic acid-specific acetylesterase